MSSGKINKRSDNTYAMLRNNLYVEINSFIVDKNTKMEYTIVQKLRLANAFGNACEMVKKIIQISEYETPILTNSISKICVHVTVNENEYTCTMPNSYSYWKHDSNSDQY